MACVRVLDLDGSLTPQAELAAPDGIDRANARDWGRRIRLACSFRMFSGFERWLDNAINDDEPSVTFYGSGDFHHVTLALIRRIGGPFNLLVLDKHPDWMRAIPFLHCGTWLRHALRLHGLQRVFHCGGLADFDNAYRYLAPWPEIRTGRVITFPPVARWTRGPWAGIRSYPLCASEGSLAGALRNTLAPFRADLGRVPLYVSVDKDVLTCEDAAVNWDSGVLRLPWALEIIQVFLEAAEGRLAGADVLGDWSPVRLDTTLNRICHWIDHPSPAHDLAQAARRNEQANVALLKALQSVTSAKS
jgi:hypothetical protein